MKHAGEIVGVLIFLLLSVAIIACLIQSIRDSGACEGRGGTYIAGKCYANP